MFTKNATLVKYSGLMSNVDEVSYSRLGRKVFTHGELELRTIQREDMESIRQWRNDQIEILRQKSVITSEQQESYFFNSVAAEFAVNSPRNMLFSLRRQGELIGYGALVHIDWEFERAEISFLLDPQYVADPAVYSEIFYGYLIALQEIAFEDLGLHRIYAETYAVRDVHLSVLERAGLTREGEMIDHVKVDGVYSNSIIHGLINPEHDRNS